MAKVKDDINADVNARWGSSDSFAERSAVAVPDSLMRQIVGDASRGLAARPVVPESKRQYAPPKAEAVPSFREWAFSRMGVDWPEAKAKDYYDRRRTAGEDVGPVRPQSPAAGVPRGGWVDPPKLSPPPGINILDRLMDHQDALDRAERAKNGGRW